jgi:hypothetical protein
MAQDINDSGGNSFELDNVTFPTARAKLNTIFDAVRTNNSGTSAPTTQYAGQFWIDTTSTTWTLYIHDGTDDIQFATIDTSANTVNFTDSALDVVTDTTPQLGGNLDLNSNDITGTGNINITGNITASGNLAGTLTTASQTNITSVGTLTSATVSGDLKVDTDTLYVDSANNRVGIGTTGPSTLLHIKGVNPVQRIEDNNETGGGAIIFSDSVRETAKINVASGASATYQINMLTTPAFRIDSNNDINFFEDTGTTPKLFWDASAESLGIGTSSPATELHVKSSDNRMQITIENDAAQGAIRMEGINPVDGSDNVWITASTSGTNRGIYFTTSDAGTPAGKILFASSGNVGIGTTSPSQALDVVGSIEVSGNIYLGGTTSANALDDYEEGTFTPSLNFGGGTTGITYEQRFGNYTKIGRLVHYKMRIKLTSKGSSGGHAQITGLPFAPSDDFTVGFEKGGDIDVWTNMNTASNYRYILADTGNIALYKIDSNTTSSFVDDAQNGDFTDTSDLRLTITFTES